MDKEELFKEDIVGIGDNMSFDGVWYNKEKEAIA